MSGTQVSGKPGGSGGGGGGSVNSVAVGGSGLTKTGTATDPIISTSAATNTSLGKADTAVQPATSPTLSGLTLTGLSGVVKATVGVLSAALILNADVDPAAGIVSTKLSAAVQTSLGKADTAVQPNTSPTLTGLTITGFSGVVKAAAGVLSAATLVNADVNAAAAIAGTKISPDFGSQNIVTTGTSTEAQLTITQAVATSGSPNAVVVTGAAHTTLAASTEASDLDLNLARTVQFATGTLTTQRAMRVRAPTYGFVGASTLTTAATVSISGAPVAGTNATITNAYALYLEAGALAMGASPSPSGDVRLSHASSIKGNNNAGGTAKTLIDWGVTTADTLIIGGADSNIRINAVTAGSVALQVNNTTILSVVGNGITVAQSNIQFTSTATTPTISQATSATASVTGAAMQLNAQDCSGTTSVTGAKLTIRAGDATGASGTRNGGGVDIRAGTGATSNGLLRLLDSATVRLTVSSVGLGLYATTPVAQATRAGALTDSTTGTPSTTLVDVGVAFSQSNVNNNFASLATKYNALELACHNLGVTA